MFTLNGAQRGTNVGQDFLIQLANVGLLKFKSKGLS